MQQDSVHLAELPVFARGVRPTLNPALQASDESKISPRPNLQCGAMTQLLTTSQIGRILNVDRTTVYRMAESGRLPAVRVGKQWRFPEADIERWMTTQRGGAAPSPAQDERPVTQDGALAAALPLACVQATQDLLADLLGAAVVVVDLQSRPVTRISNAAPLHAEVLRASHGRVDCLPGWLSFQEATSNEFAVGPLGMTWARGFVRTQDQLIGLVFVGGIAEHGAWCVDEVELASVAARIGIPTDALRVHAGGAHSADAAARVRMLDSAQRIADLFSRMADDRHKLCGKLQAIAALTIL
jgi:excisionase family DNA binding protein